MSFVHTTLRTLCANLLKLGLFGFAVTFAAVSVFGTSKPLKDSLKESGVYDKTVDSVLNYTEKQTKDSDNSVPLDKPEIKAAAQTAFPPSQLQTWAESVIDGVYGWLAGNSDQPEFRIDLTDAKQSFVRGAADYAEARLKELPACSPQESLALSRQNIDLFTVSCRPPINIAAEKKRLIRQLENSDDFLKDTVITSDDLTNDGGKIFDSKSNKLPQVFQFVGRLPLLLGLLGLLTGTGLVLLSDDRRHGLRRIAFIMLGTGVFLLVSSLLFAYLFGRVNRPGGAISQLVDLDSSGLQASALQTARSLQGIFSSMIVKISILYGLLGAAILLGLRFTEHKNPTAAVTAKPPKRRS